MVSPRIAVGGDDSRGRIANAKELDFSNACGVHVTHSLTPLEEGDLDVVVALNANIIAVLVSVPELQQALTNAAAREPRKFGVDAVDKSLVGDIEGHHKSKICPALAVDLDLQLGGQGHLVDAKRVVHHVRRRRDCSA